MDQTTLERMAGCYDRTWDCRECKALDSVGEDGICEECEHDHNPDQDHAYEWARDEEQI